MSPIKSPYPIQKQPPHLIVIAGPNGAGKSTTAPSLLKGTLKVAEFVNADVIAQGLSGFQPEGAVFHAGRVMLERIHYLAKKKVDFAFETTLSSKTFAPWITDLRKKSYKFHMIFLWLPNDDFAAARVAERVRMGGHNVPEETIRRRYHSGLKNFFHLYLPLADTWDLYDNSGPKPRLVAFRDGEKGMIVNDSMIWHNIKKKYEKKRKT
jgi:predicted ABC-type ATPase